MQFQQRQLWALQNLENNMKNSDASTFQESLRKFTFQLLFASINQFSSFHFMTTVFEFFIIYLIFRSCSVAVLISQFWINIHLLWFVHVEQSSLTREISNRDLQIYASSLLELITCYCQLLSHLDSLSSSAFRLDLSNYSSRLLHRRNTELLALVIVNLRLSNVEVNDFKEVWRRVCQMCAIF